MKIGHLFAADVDEKIEMPVDNFLLKMDRARLQRQQKRKFIVNYKLHQRADSNSGVDDEAQLPEDDFVSSV